MAIKELLLQTIRNLEAEKNSVAAVAKDKAMKEKIVPFNQEIDKARDNAIAEKQQALNATILAHQEQFAKEKKEMYEAAEKKKSDNASAVIASETYAVTVEYDKIIAQLNEQVEEFSK